MDGRPRLRCKEGHTAIPTSAERHELLTRDALIPYSQVVQHGSHGLLFMQLKTWTGGAQVLATVRFVPVIRKFSAIQVCLHQCHSRKGLGTAQLRAGVELVCRDPPDLNRMPSKLLLTTAAAAATTTTTTTSVTSFCMVYLVVAENTSLMHVQKQL